MFVFVKKRVQFSLSVCVQPRTCLVFVIEKPLNLLQVQFSWSRVDYDYTVGKQQTTQTGNTLNVNTFANENRTFIPTPKHDFSALAGKQTHCS